MKLKNALLLFVLTFSLSGLFAQQQNDSLHVSKKVIVIMKNGDEFKGVILNKDDQTIRLQTVNGELNLRMANVKKIEDDSYVGKFGFPNPHDTRYFFGPTAIPIKKHKGYYQNVMLTTNFVNYGITKNVSIGGGLEFVSTILGEPIWFLTPKVGFDLSKNVHAGGGMIMVGMGREVAATLGYGVFTLGNSESNLTVGAGYGIMSGKIAKNPAIMISGTHRLNTSIALLSENYIIPNSVDNSFYFGVHGIRIMSKKNSFDIGAIVIPEIMQYIPALPFVGYARSF